MTPEKLRAVIVKLRDRHRSGTKEGKDFDLDACSVYDYLLRQVEVDAINIQTMLTEIHLMDALCYPQKIYRSQIVKMYYPGLMKIISDIRF